MKTKTTHSFSDLPLRDDPTRTEVICTVRQEKCLNFCLFPFCHGWNTAAGLAVRSTSYDFVLLSLGFHGIRVQVSDFICFFTFTSGQWFLELPAMSARFSVTCNSIRTCLPAQLFFSEMHLSGWDLFFVKGGGGFFLTHLPVQLSVPQAMSDLSIIVINSTPPSRACSFAGTSRCMWARPTAEATGGLYYTCA